MAAKQKIRLELNTRGYRTMAKQISEPFTAYLNEVVRGMSPAPEFGEVKITFANEAAFATCEAKKGTTSQLKTVVMEVARKFDIAGSEKRSNPMPVEAEVVTVVDF